MLGLRAAEPFKPELHSKGAYLTDEILVVGHDEPDRGVGSDVDSGRESLSSTGGGVFCADEKDHVQPPSKVKVVGELLKKDVKSVQATNAVSPYVQPMVNGIDLSSLIIAKDIIIGGSPFSKTEPKPKKASSPDERKRRPVDAKSKAAATGKSAATPAANVEKPKSKETKLPLLRKQAVVRSSSKDSVCGLPAPTSPLGGSERLKSKLSPKLSLDSKTKDAKREAKTNGRSDAKKLTRSSPVSSLRVKNSDCRTNRGSATTYRQCHESAVNRKCNGLQNSYFKSLSEVFSTCSDDDIDWFPVEEVQVI